MAGTLMPAQRLSRVYRSLRDAQERDVPVIFCWQVSSSSMRLPLLTMSNALLRLAIAGASLYQLVLWDSETIKPGKNRA
ncbi:hypothetical protein N018_21130 [Pseudomonas syringae CC1557]|uniref:Uncharacterized protein n=1 Tax=Pseudomonas syringae CC1557 TaxID=1357279 RepID=W0MYK6_PSESX|nr:hypothetical protein N018_21130 [Pseudomonas syringae CC1557]